MYEMTEPVRLTADTYKGRHEEIESVKVQVRLAGLAVETLRNMSVTTTSGRACRLIEKQNRNACGFTLVTQARWSS